MDQIEDKKTDIYQILSHCLGSLKRKILLYLKAYTNQLNFIPQSKIVQELGNQFQLSQKYVQQCKFINFHNKSDQILYQRFVCRIKQLVRNYLPHASKSHQIFVFLKKIQTFSFKPEYDMQSYIKLILVENPEKFQQKINCHILQKSQQSKNSENLYEDYKKNFKLEKSLILYRSKEVKKNKKAISKQSTTIATLSLQQNEKSLNTQKQKQKSLILKNQKESAPLRPIDVFNNSVKGLNCLDVDLSDIRGAYFQYQRQKQMTNFTKLQNSMQEEMLDRNRLVKESITYYDKMHAKYLQRVKKYPQRYKNFSLVHTRCRTADTFRKDINFSILGNRQNRKQKSALNRTHKFIQKNKKYETISYGSSQQQKNNIYKELIERKNNVLKMNSICLSNKSGNLELCAQNKDKIRTNPFNSKRIIYKNTVTNLKKRYDNFLNQQKIINSERHEVKYNTIQSQSNCKPRRTMKQKKQLRLFQVLNPELTIVTFRKN